MSKVKMSAEVDVAVDKLWQFIGSFNALPDWHPAVEKSELEEAGQIRKLALVGGGSIIERLERIDDNERLYSYSILESPLPVANYTATIRVRSDGDERSIVEWSGEFSPLGTSEQDAVNVIQEIYQTGLDNLKKMFGG